MFTRRFLPALVLAALFSPFSHAADGPDPRVVAEMTRYLRAIQFGDTFLGGVLKANSAQGQGSAFLDRILKASPPEIEATVAPAFADHVTLKEAKALADFFAGPVGRKVITLGEKGLSREEARELEKFGQTPTGKLAVTLTTDSSIRQQYFTLLKAKYEPQ